MCGLAGALAYHPDAPAVDVGELLRVRDRMVARGPDGAGLWLSDDRRVGLAHRRLAIIELSESGAQPMADPANGNCIVFNGEIYNHAELREQLVRDGVPVHSQSDTEVLLKLYARHGTAMLKMLRGMFAFVVWDAAHQKMLLARDAFGIKPLYLANDGRTLRFASQVKALLAAPVDTRPEPAGHVGFLLWGSVPEPYTLFKGIRALPPGHWLEVVQGQVGRPVCFDSPRLALTEVQNASVLPVPEALAQMVQGIQDSVAAHMVADVDVGVFLSAGLDSTMLASTAASHGRLRTTTLGFDEYAGGPFDEAALAGVVAQLLGTDHHLHQISAAHFAADREAMLSAMDQPSIDGINTWFVAKAAAQQGLKVALSGIGGDELMGSYPSFQQVPKLREQLAPLAHAPWVGRASRQLLAPFGNLLPSPKYAGLLEYGSTLGGAYQLRRGLFMPWEVAQLLGRGMANEGLQELGTTTALNHSMDGLVPDRLAMSALEMQWYMKNQLLRDADWAGMAHSLEIRVPFVDTTLLRQLSPLPSVPVGEQKAMVARAVAPNLPEAVLNRPKTGFAVPIHQWLNPGAEMTAGNHRGWARMLYQRFTGGALA